ncbi:MAG: glutathione S-transferase C-terminal domain-containing protein, partial [Myxococcota bacterium]
MRLFIHPALEASHVPLLMGTAPSDPAEIIAVVPERNGPGRWSDGQDHPEVDPTRTPVWEDGRSAVIEAPAPVAELLKTIRAVGRATEQARYEMLARETFAQLDAFDARLAAQRYLSGSQEPGLEDMWLFAVLVRFDSAYYGFYKLTQRRIASYPQLGPWLRDLYQRDGVANTVQWTTIVRHFAWESEGTNPKRLVPRGGIPDLRVPHDRWRFHPQAQDGSGAIEEDPSRPRRPGEWVRPQSG